MVNRVSTRQRKTKKAHLAAVAEYGGSHHLLLTSVGRKMATIGSGALVTLEELLPSSPYFKHGTSLRVTGKLLEYNVGTAVAVIVDRNASLQIDTRHLNLNLRVGSIFQFIGELLLEPNQEAILKARVGRNVDGMDLNLYRQSLQLLRDFQAGQMNS